MTATSFACDVGDKIRVTATFTDVDDSSAVTPTDVSMGYELPDGSSVVKVYGTDPEVTLVSAGVYRLLIDCAQAGTYRVRCWSTGTGQAAEAGEVYAKRAPF